MVLWQKGDLLALDPLAGPPPWAPPLAGSVLVASRVSLIALTRNLTDMLAAYHLAHPLKLGEPREEVKSRLKMPPKVFNAFVGWLAAKGAVAEAGALLKLPAHQITFTPDQQASVERLLAVYARDPYNTPSTKDSIGIVGEEVLAVLVERGDVVQVSAEVLFLRDTYGQMVGAIKAHLAEHTTITVAQVRDMFASSRKYVLALMEHLDTIGVTMRKGDERVLK